MMKICWVRVIELSNRYKPSGTKGEFNPTHMDAIIVGFEKITREIIFAAPKLKVIAKHGAGIDNIDVSAASERGITVVTAKRILI